MQFQSTCPVRGTTVDGFFNSGAIHISIHVPRTGHDRTHSGQRHDQRDFNPRAPYGARPETREYAAISYEFQSTCPVRGTTVVRGARRVHIAISIHVPRTGHDPVPSAPLCRHGNFNPRAPYGARPLPLWTFWRTFQISIHVPRTGHDAYRLSISLAPSNFNPRAPYGARLLAAHALLHIRLFQSTCPVRGTTAVCRTMSI